MRIIFDALKSFLHVKGLFFCFTFFYIYVYIYFSCSTDVWGGGYLHKCDHYLRNGLPQNRKILPQFGLFCHKVGSVYQILGTFYNSVGILCHKRTHFATT